MIIRNPLIFGELDKSVVSPASAMVNGQIVFTIYGGPILILALLSICVTANSAAANTMFWTASPTIGTPKQITAATGALASATAGTTILLNPTSLVTAPDIVTAAAGGVQIGANVSNRIMVPAGSLTLGCSGVNPGTWQHYLRYSPLSPDVVVNV